MTAFGIDTSMSVVSFAVVEDDRVLACFNEDVGRNLTDKISQITKSLLEKSKKKISDIDRCGIVVGPGSFTGLRVGTAFAKGLFAGAKTKIAPVSSLECIARASGEKGNVCVLSDARNGEVFFAKFAISDEFVRLCDERRISREEALEKIDEGDKIIEEPFNLAQICGETLAKLALETQNLTAIEDVFPNYMQVSYAERCKK